MHAVLLRYSRRLCTSRYTALGALLVPSLHLKRP
jgi:hypothetical protein